MFFLIKITKKGIFTCLQSDVASGASWRADMARGTTARGRRGAEATWQSHGWPTRGAGGAQGADTWQEATRVRTSTRMPVWGATWQERSACEGPTG